MIMPIKTVDVTTLKHWMDNNEVVLVDVREPAEHVAKSIPGSTLLPSGKVNKSALPDANGKKLVIHCNTSRRSSNACEKLMKEDPNLEIFRLEGGISAWSEAGHSVNSSGKFFLPLDRQVQLTIGLFVLVGSFLAYFVSPMFFLLTGFFGAGLTFAGISGFCGLAMLMAKMPWNKVAN
jgi:rhodanese-related sulfurtransferase